MIFNLLSGRKEYYFFFLRKELIFRIRISFHYNISIRKSMKITALILLLVATWAQTCGKGGLQCDQDSCHYPPYIEGCLTYAVDSSCASCEYSNSPFIQITSLVVEDASMLLTSKASIAVRSSIVPEHVLYAPRAYPSTPLQDFAKTRRLRDAL